MRIFIKVSFAAILFLAVATPASVVAVNDSAHAEESSHGDEFRHPIVNEYELPHFQLVEPEDQKIVSDGIDQFTDYQLSTHGLALANKVGEF